MYTNHTLTFPPRRPSPSGGWSSGPRCVPSSCWSSGLPSYTQSCGPMSYFHRLVSLRDSKKTHIISTPTFTLSRVQCFLLISGVCTHILWLSVAVWPPGWQAESCSRSPESSSCPHWETPGLWSYAQSLQRSKKKNIFFTYKSLFICIRF